MELWQQRIRAGNAAHVINLALDYMAEATRMPLPVWAVLQMNKIKGCGLQTCCCPIARYLQQFVHDGIVHVYDDHYLVIMDDNARIAGPLPYPVRDFIRRFDAGDFPILIDYDHMHGLLGVSQN